MAEARFPVPVTFLVGEKERSKRDRSQKNTMTDLTIFHGHSRSNPLEYIDDEQASVLTMKVSNVVSEDMYWFVLRDGVARSGGIFRVD